MKRFGFYIALAVLAVIVLLPTPEGLSVAGHRMIGVMVFSVIVWATTAISYPVSAGVIMVLIALWLGLHLMRQPAGCTEQVPGSAWR